MRSRQVVCIRCYRFCVGTGLLADLARAQPGEGSRGGPVCRLQRRRQGGVKSELYGATRQGMLIFEADGRNSLTRSEYLSVARHF